MIKKPAGCRPREHAKGYAHVRRYVCCAGINLYMRPANGRRRYIVTSSLIDWAHIQNGPWLRRVSMAVADGLVPNRHQAINHHDDLTDLGDASTTNIWHITIIKHTV